MTRDLSDHVCAAKPSAGAHTITKMPKTVTKPASGRSRRRPAEPLTQAEVLALMKACGQRAPTGIRNRALIAVLWRSGLRISEALELELRDVDLDAGSLRVRHGKGDRSRTVGIDEQTTALLARWLDRRQRLEVGARAPAFCTLRGAQIDSSYIRRLLPRLAARAGVQKRVHAHGLRHTHAAELVREGTPINVIRDALGHTSLAVTDRYLRDVAPQAVIDTIRARRWEPT
jgi:site-specific recombinase XerD